MNNRASPVLVTLVAVLLVCCLFATSGTLALVGWMILSPSSPEVAVLEPAATVTRFPFPTAAPAGASGGTATPTNTRVIDPSEYVWQTPAAVQTRAAATLPLSVAAINYDIIVPTPPAPSMVHPVGFDSYLKVVTLPVKGTTLSELSRSLEENALADSHEPGSRYYARTDWFLSGRWYWKPTARGCELDRGSVSLAMTMTLPIMVDKIAAPSNIQSRWISFVNNTIIHETGHVDLALQGARDYQRTLGGVLPANDCETMKVRLDTLFRNAFAAIDQAQVDYDADTRHGMRQGAVFP